MKETAHHIQLLLDKQRNTLEEQLKGAIENGMILKQYAPMKKKQQKESVEEFAFRLFQQASKYQFVQVVFDGERKHVVFGVSGPIITEQGEFTLLPASVVGGKWGWHYILLYPDLETVIREKEIFIRLDSGCLSGQMFGDITCDCREQFDIALKSCRVNKSGIIISIPRHDGRGWNGFKMANQQLMNDCGLDTVAAARLFYQDEAAIDQRTYTEAVLILRALGFGEYHFFNLATNNPRKIGAFHALGMNLKCSQPVIAKKMNPTLKKNLIAKSKNWKHDFGKSIA